VKPYVIKIGNFADLLLFVYFLSLFQRAAAASQSNISAFLTSFIRHTQFMDNFLSAPNTVKYLARLCPITDPLPEASF
jgi:hypothetical protein